MCGSEPGIVFFLCILSWRHRQFAFLEVDFTQRLQGYFLRLRVRTHELRGRILTGAESTRGRVGPPRHDNAHCLFQVCVQELLVRNPDRQDLIKVARRDYAMDQE